VSKTHVSLNSSDSSCCEQLSSACPGSKHECTLVSTCSGFGGAFRHAIKGTCPHHSDASKPVLASKTVRKPTGYLLC
jgi:hypothetical protein